MQSRTWTRMLLLGLLLVINIIREEVVICQRERDSDDSEHSHGHVRVRRLIGAVASASARPAQITVPADTHADGGRSNYYQATRTPQPQRPNRIDYDNRNGSNDDDDDSSDEEDDNDNNLSSSQEIRELVEQNIIQRSKAKVNGGGDGGGGGAGGVGIEFGGGARAGDPGARRKHRGPPPFMNTLQSSSQEEFIVRTEPSTPGIAGGAGVVGKDKVILIPTKKGDKRRKSSSSNHNYLTNNIHGAGSESGPLHSGGASAGAGVGKTHPHRPKTQCVCDTRDCISSESGATICVTHGMCYTQYLERDDGTPSITKGCISGETPLLCENRRPSSTLLRNTRWPYLVCCKSHLCNAGDLKTTTKKPKSSTTASIFGGGTTQMTSSSSSSSLADFFDTDDDDSTSAEGDLSSTNVTNVGQSGTTHENHTASTDVLASLLPGPGTHTQAPSRGSRLLSPLASAFLIGGAVLIVLVSLLGFWILRREQHKLARRYYQKTETETDTPHADAETEHHDEHGPNHPNVRSQCSNEAHSHSHLHQAHAHENQNFEEIHEGIPPGDDGPIPTTTPNSKAKSTSKPLLPKIKNVKVTVSPGSSGQNGHYKKKNVQKSCDKTSDQSRTRTPAEEELLGGHHEHEHEHGNELNSNSTIPAPPAAASAPASASSLSLLSVPTAASHHSSSHQHPDPPDRAASSKRKTTIL